MAKKKAKKRPGKKKPARKGKTKWACPDCGMDHTGKHKKTLKKQCSSAWTRQCVGFICECEGDTARGHGDSVDDPCLHATCYHCGWGGVFPGQGEATRDAKNYKYLYACKVTEAKDYRDYLKFILKFLKDAWDEDEGQEDVEPSERFGFFEPDPSYRHSRNWCPSLIEELTELLEPGTEWAPAEI